MLPKRYVHRIEQGGVLPDAFSGMVRKAEHPRTVQMQPDSALARIGADLLHYAGIEHFMIFAADGTLDHDRADRSRDAPAGRTLHPAPDFRPLEGSHTGDAWNSVYTAV